MELEGAAPSVIRSPSEKQESLVADAPSTPAAFEAEVAAGERFEFGANWSRFLANLDDRRIADAEESVRSLLGVTDLTGKSFLDIGSGSGLFSLIAARLGARVHSLDYDPQSVACTQHLKTRYAPNASWRVERGSALDPQYLKSLGAFDVVYSWGVLHHTGQMWQALANAAGCVAPKGTLAVAIYNDQGWRSRYWTWVKKTYCSGALGRLAMTLLNLPIEFLPRVAFRLITGRFFDKKLRGMSYWRDYIDWIGGYPFEVASAQQLSAFYQEKGFRLVRSILTHRKGCNELVFEKS
jgi:2-polyprenyl-6-hydroxyphenyl methylase/3-demethylubiquinone-9 3-methyltransferase